MRHLAAHEPEESVLASLAKGCTYLSCPMHSKVYQRDDALVRHLRNPSLHPRAELVNFCYGHEPNEDIDNLDQKELAKRVVAILKDRRDSAPYGPWKRLAQLWAAEGYDVKRGSMGLGTAAQALGPRLYELVGVTGFESGAGNYLPVLSDAPAMSAARPTTSSPMSYMSELGMTNYGTSDFNPSSHIAVPVPDPDSNLYDPRFDPTFYQGTPNEGYDHSNYYDYDNM
jgi:hypothetical protein